ncbi:TOBE domain protein [compost metagenome]
MSLADGVVEDTIDVGMHRTVMVRVGQSVIACRKFENGDGYARGQAVTIGFHAHDLHVVAK